MKVVILAGGLGTRLSEETAIRPKPMVEIGGRPVLWHIMKIYSAHGINDFIVCFGYKGYIKGGFFVLSSKVGSYIEDDRTIWEREPLERLSREGQLHAYRHEGFWQPMDTLRDKVYLEELWTGGKAPWKVWP